MSTIKKSIVGRCLDAVENPSEKMCLLLAPIGVVSGFVFIAGFLRWAHTLP